MAELTAPTWAQPCAGFRSRKAAQISAYYASQSGGRIDKLKLIKLMYLSERSFLSLYHHPMLFDEYYSLPHGPICSSTLNGIDGIIHEALWNNYIARDGNRVVAVRAVDRADLDEVSDAEMAVITEIWQTFSRMTTSQTRNYTHDHCPEYTETDKARIPITYQQILEALGEEDADELAEEIQDMVKLEGVLEGDE